MSNTKISYGNIVSGEYKEIPQNSDITIEVSNSRFSIYFTDNSISIRKTDGISNIRLEIVAGNLIRIINEEED